MTLVTNVDAARRPRCPQLAPTAAAALLTITIITVVEVMAPQHRQHLVLELLLLGIQSELLQVVVTTQDPSAGITTQNIVRSKLSCRL
jgi:hypothetical protein